MRFKRLLVAASMIACLGCDAGEAPPEEAVEAPASAGDTATPPTPPENAVEVEAVERSAVRGSASFNRDGGDVVITLHLEGLEPGIRYSGYLREGWCETGGPVELPLGRVTAGDDGAARRRLRASAEELSEDMALHVQLQGPEGPVACADVTEEGS